ncbi:TRAP transporter small permease [Jannaschia seohaensis]|uniref:TRAP transporter small permease protein n=1 Tax=Jannaschia seohaensis TaxID=475081 RepID=A0A2Y9AIC6_9RHOB|nr:TRAP transporter small permease [Jannaschia seohaensis]PWJ20219.1 TRAP-type C4-dicarboxylate transport system permease small subunit [Jannaschia seohaensis]SSA44214.1 TRAP-type C4-dicarboxylate transport system, small permease component [Jannaschia seohaensis]
MTDGPEERVSAPTEAPEIHFDEQEIDLSDLKWDDVPVFVIFWILAFVVFLQFFTRYVLNDSLGWTEEIARFLLIAVTFTGAIMAVRKESHIAVEFLYRWIPRTGRRIAQAGIDAVTIAFFGFLTVLTIRLAGRTQQMMVSIDVPKSYVYWFVALCFGGMTVYALVNAWRHLRTGTSKLIDPQLHAQGVPRTD